MDIIFHFILKSFQYCGLCPISLNLPIDYIANRNPNIAAASSSPSDAPIVLWTTVCFVLMCFYAISISIYFRMHILIDFNDINKFTASVKLESVFITHLIIIFESLMTKSVHNQLWNRAHAIDRQFKQLHLDDDNFQRKVLHRNGALKFIGFELIALSIEVNMLFVDRLQGWTYIRYATVLSTMVTRTRHLQHMLYVDSVRMRFLVLRQELSEMVRRSKVVLLEVEKKREPNADDVIAELAERLKMVKTIYTMLFEMTLNLNTCFGLSQLANITLNFIELINDLYWLYAELNINLLTNIWDRCALLLPVGLALSMLMYSCEQCLREVYGRRLCDFL